MDTPAPILPPTIAGNVRHYFGHRGEQWLAYFPEIVLEICRKWELVLQKPFSNLSINYVTPVLQADGSSAVLKLGVPGSGMEDEMAALRHFNGRSMVQLLKADPKNGAMLLEHIYPGHSLSQVNDDHSATQIISHLINRIHTSPSSEGEFPNISDWFGDLFEWQESSISKIFPIPVDMVLKAQKRADQLLGTAAPPTVLHGDLHHENILNSGDDIWLLIDPKGVLGEPVYETAAMLRNGLPNDPDCPDLQRILEQRIQDLSDNFQFDPDRIAHWGFCQTVLSIIWASGAGNIPDLRWIRIAQVLSAMCT